MNNNSIPIIRGDTDVPPPDLMASPSLGVATPESTFSECSTPSDTHDDSAVTVKLVDGAKKQLELMDDDFVASLLTCPWRAKGGQKTDSSSYKSSTTASAPNDKAAPSLLPAQGRTGSSQAAQSSSSQAGNPQTNSSTRPRN